MLLKALALDEVRESPEGKATLPQFVRCGHLQLVGETLASTRLLKWGP